MGVKSATLTAWVWLIEIITMDNMSPDEAHKFAYNYYGWDDDDTSSESSGPIFDERGFYYAK